MRKVCELVDVDFALVSKLFCCLEAISGLCSEGLRMTWGHLGQILEHLEAISEAILRRKACELVDVDFTLVFKAFVKAWRQFRGYVWRA